VSGFATLATVALGTVVTAMPADAISFIASYNDTISAVSGTLSGVSVGDQLSISIELDNGGASISNQTWTSANVVNIIFDFNNGANRTVFNPVFDDNTGSFTTNGSGILTAVPTNWIADNTASVQSTNSASTPNAWYINGSNGIYYTSSFANEVNVGDPNQLTVATNWAIAPAPTAVPFDFDPSFGLLALGGVWAARKMIKKSKSVVKK